ncbi:MAG: molybdopterin converting factor subunit 1 [Thioalkalispiraceae bacterium]|jgi:molybdopterin synthase sulfur carrier subunit
MTVEVKFFASLRERVGKSEEELDAAGQSVRDIWQQTSGEQVLPDNMLIAVNMEYVDREYIVKDGDEVAFFPPVTGG